MAPYLTPSRLTALAAVVPLAGMKLYTTFAASLNAAFFVTTMAQANTSLRIMTWNLRFDSMPDNITVQETIDSLPDPILQPDFFGVSGEQPWSTRRIKVYDRIVGEKVQILGFQEALVRQVDDMATLLGDEWDHVGVGRDDGVAAGEFSPIFWNSNVFQLEDWDTFWLSNDPFDAGSKFPGAGSVRIATYTRFTIKATGKDFVYMNTHLDDQSDAQRQLGASLILWRAHSDASNGSKVIVTGDFNSPANGTDSGAYQIITGGKTPVAINQTFAGAFPINNATLPDFVCDDVRTQVPRVNVGGQWATFTGFNKPGDASDFTHIDFIFGGSNGGVTPQFFKVESQLTDDGVLASDHRPVIADIEV